MKKPPAIYGIGWTEPGPDTPAVTFSYVGRSDEDVAIALAAVVGHENSSGAYAIARDDAERIIDRLPAGDVADLLADMTEDELDIVAIFSADRAGASTSPGAESLRAESLRDLFDSGRADVVYGEAHWWPTDDAATDPYPLIEQWAKVWPDSLPIAHELKELFEAQWVRLHTLPGSKRSPSSDAEWGVVLDRHNTLLGELAEAGEAVLVIMSVVAPAPVPAEPDLDFWAAVPWHYADPDLLFAHLYVTTEEWSHGALDDLLRLAAEQQIGGVIIAPLDLSWLYHPYAGGADVILADPAGRDALAAAHPSWRSQHPSGL
jgi:hypothetical protein